MHGNTFMFSCLSNVESTHNPIALRTAKTLCFGCSECNRKLYGVLAVLSAVGFKGRNKISKFFPLKIDRNLEVKVKWQSYLP